ncbi:MAG TPA: chromosomal replication initiator protein DnaA [Phycisphaerae bacterium]|nr:chromosomal replication initiator protein DnaA [Phycisphaerae bacterium]
MDRISETVWADILGFVRAHHPAISRGWFSQLRPGHLVGGELQVLAENSAQLCYLEEHCLHPFVEAAQAATGRLVSVRFEGSGDSPVAPPDHAQGPSYGMEPGVPPVRLNGDYVFENFVVGPCNQLAHATCSAVSQSPGTVYNPLFIHGSAGLGKTHLLQAVCHRILDHSPAVRIVYLSCEMFVNHFVEAVEKGAMGSFRYRYRHADLLLIDDLQFLTGKDRTQEEFFHTFNTLYQLHKQIVLSADCSPADIPQLEERLISRFKWGLVARIDSPCFETRLAILRKKLGLRGWQLPDDVINHLATTIKSNARELEGALNRLHSHAMVENRPVDLAFAQRVLGGDRPLQQRAIRIQDIMNVVTDRFAVKLTDLQSRKRSRSIVLPRQVCMYFARQLTPHSLGEIGGFFGGRDHTTVIHANRLVARRRQKDSAFRTRLEEIEMALQGT